MIMMLPIDGIFFIALKNVDIDKNKSPVKLCIFWDIILAIV